MVQRGVAALLAGCAFLVASCGLSLDVQPPSPAYLRDPICDSCDSTYSRWWP